MSTKGRTRCTYDTCRRLAVAGSTRCPDHPRNVARVQRPIEEATPVVLERPEGMTAEAIVVWDEFAPRHAVSGTASPEDATMLAAWCEGVALGDRVRPALRAPLITATSGAIRVSPALAVWREAVATTLRISEHFGWTPLARARMRHDEATDAPTPDNDPLFPDEG